MSPIRSPRWPPPAAGSGPPITGGRYHARPAPGRSFGPGPWLPRIRREERAGGPARAGALAGRILGVLDDGALCLLISLGHRCGLFDARRGMTSATSAEIAAKAGLDERHVRERLGARVTSRVVEVDPATHRCRLPAEPAATSRAPASARSKKHELAHDIQNDWDVVRK